MKILGIINNERYICEINHSELEKYLNLYYGKLRRLRPGEVVELDKGYEFHRRIVEEYSKYRQFVKANQESLRKGLLDFIIKAEGIRAFANIEANIEEENDVSRD